MPRTNRVKGMQSFSLLTSSLLMREMQMRRAKWSVAAARARKHARERARRAALRPPSLSARARSSTMTTAFGVASPAPCGDHEAAVVPHTMANRRVAYLVRRPQVHLCQVHFARAAARSGCRILGATARATHPRARQRIPLARKRL